MSYLDKTYNYVSQENFDGFLKSIGIPDEKAQVLLKFTPSQKLVKNGDTYTYYTSTDGKPKEVSFKSGVEFDDKIGEENIPIKSVYTVDGNTVTQVINSAKGSATFLREYNGDELVVTITTDKWDGVAKRVYKA